MLKLKICPRCRTGDMLIDRDVYGWCALCLQCGYMMDLDSASKVGDEVVVAERKRVAVRQPA